VRKHNWFRIADLVALVCIFTGAAQAVIQGQPFHLPTANRALLEPGGEERFFTGTAGTNFLSGSFGCVRTQGRQMHEGLDIQPLHRDRHGEATDPIMATANGTVSYINAKSGLSNYGKYIVLRHSIEGLEVFSLYAHLSDIRNDLRVGQAVKAREVIGTMGRSTNTRQPIPKARAHLHFEIALFVNDRFPAWYQKTYPTQRNDHGQWNGMNLRGIDPGLIFISQEATGANFSLLSFVRNQTALCRVLVRDTQFPWLRRYPLLVRRNPIADRAGAAAYEISLNYNGVPFELIPRAASEIGSGPRYQLLHVDEAEQSANPCRNLVTRKSGRWELAPAGNRLLDLLTY
jgi:peptidoglycan LD-endopeptidase LytH